MSCLRVHLYPACVLVLLAAGCGSQDSALFPDSGATSGGGENSGSVGPAGPAGQTGAAGPAGPQGESFRAATQRMLNNVKAFKAGVVNLLCNGASGSGTRISADTVVTAFHVIDGATSCVVRSDGGLELNFQLIFEQND